MRPQYTNLLLLVGIFENIEDIDIRLHQRSQMQAAGFDELRNLLVGFKSDNIDTLLAHLQRLMDEDEQKLKEQVDQEMLKSYGDPKDVYSALVERTGGTKAADYFLSIMQHLLLIREDGPALTHYYQLLDGIVTDVVLDKKLAGAEGRLGNSVSKIIASLNDADRVQQLQDEAQESRSQAARLKFEKEALEEEIATGEGGLVGRLKEEIKHLEEKLAISRATTTRLQGQLEAQKAGYDEQIAQLEAQIMALFEMLRNLNKDVRKELEKMDDSAMNRKTLIDNLDRHFQRAVTQDILEGKKNKSKRSGRNGGDGDDQDEGEDDDDVDSVASPRRGSLKRSKPVRSSKSTRISEAQGGRVSQFMDADDAEEEEQMQQQLAASASGVRSFPTSTAGGFCADVLPTVFSARRTSLKLEKREEPST